MSDIKTGVKRDLVDLDKFRDTSRRVPAYVLLLGEEPIGAPQRPEQLSAMSERYLERHARDYR